jgi:hypothetical protein
MSTTSISLHKENNRKYQASYFFNGIGVVDCHYQFTTRVCKSKDGSIQEEVPVIVITGVRPSDGLIVESEMWAYAHATREDLEKLPATVSDFWFSIGTAMVQALDENNRPLFDERGNKVMVPVEGKPKLLGYYVDGSDQLIRFSGEKREYNANDYDSTLVDNRAVAEKPADALDEIPTE